MFGIYKLFSHVLLFLFSVKASVFKLPQENVYLFLINHTFSKPVQYTQRCKSGTVRKYKSEIVNGCILHESAQSVN